VTCGWLWLTCRFDTGIRLLVFSYIAYIYLILVTVCQYFVTRNHSSLFASDQFLPNQPVPYLGDFTCSIALTSSSNSMVCFHFFCCIVSRYFFYFHLFLFKVFLFLHSVVAL